MSSLSEPRLNPYMEENIYYLYVEMTSVIEST